MKKMIMIAAALLVAVVSEAIGLQWSVAGIGAGSTAFLVSGSDTDSAIELMAAGKTDLSSIAWGNKGVAGENGVANVPATTTGSGITDGLSTGEYSAFVAVITAADDKGNWKYGVTSVKDVNKTGNAGNVIFAFGNVADSVKWETYTAGSGDDPIIPDVPEPTSMALLALGAAAFGLRRKFSK